MIMSSKIKYEHITRGVFFMNVLYEVLTEVVREFAANTTKFALWLEISRNLLDAKSMSVWS